MVHKIKNPGDFFTFVEKVVSEDRVDSNGVSYVYREMTSAHGTVVEDIYTFKDKGRIEFRVHKEDRVVVNQFVFDKKVIEYVLEDKQGNRLGWIKSPGARDGALQAIIKTYELAAKH